MKNTPLILIQFSTAGLVSAIILYLGITFNYIHVPAFVLLIFAVMVLAIWFRMSKEIRERIKEKNLFGMISSYTPAWLKLTVFLVIIFAVLNFLWIRDHKETAGYINFNPSTAKVQIVSAFMAALFAIESMISFSLFQINKRKESGNNSDAG